MFAEVVFNKPIKPLTYRLSGDLRHARPGMRVSVKLHRRSTTGIIYRLSATSDLTRIEPVDKILDSVPVLNEDLIQVAEWLSHHYLCSVGEALWTIIPKGFKKREVDAFVEQPSAQEEEQSDIILTPEQNSVFDHLKKSFHKSGSKHFLLYGVTGSGKTEIYLRIIHEVLRQGKGAILLVPEISLTPQTVRYFSKRVGDQLGLLHSRLTKAQKINEWHKIHTGQKKIVIGARSAIFAPMEKIGIIIIDEEHETSYKSEETPRYNAKSVAYFRAQKHGATLLLGSATPSLESYYLAKNDKLELLQLPRRVLNQKLPSTHIADLRKIKGEKYISNPLFKAIEKRLKQHEQIILFLNRRGFSPHVYCENCGYLYKCKHCDITLTFHKKDMKLSCHYCGYSIRVQDVCPSCRNENLHYAGFGTEKVEKVLNDYFPGAVVVRMDTDSVRRRESLSQILSAFAKNQIDILIGTQIVTKGLHFPNVTLVGVLNADIPLNFPDFRAAERTFNLITQVAGRAGRSEKGGEVVIQTYNPVHYAIQTARSQDYEEFFIHEIKYREHLNYPPFCRIIRLVFRGSNPKALFETAYLAVSLIQDKTAKYQAILGPTYCPLSRIKNNYRVHVIIKVSQIASIRTVIADIQSTLGKKHGLYLEIDIDPISML
jgi:primosomal protein N' (replication factor Y)